METKASNDMVCLSGYKIHPKVKKALIIPVTMMNLLITLSYFYTFNKMFFQVTSILGLMALAVLLSEIARIYKKV